jgi:branched-chain amino acid transport system ATP-binding protein
VTLETVELRKAFGGVVALDGASVAFHEGKVNALIGPNGSGKTTFVNIVTGYIKPSEGKVLFKGKDITGLEPRDVVLGGIARSFQIPQLYKNLTILENMLIAVAIRQRQHWNFWKPLHTEDREALALEVLDRFGFKESAGQTVGTLPEGGRKLLDVALSFALEPNLLLLDEPTSGVSVEEKFGIMDSLMAVLRTSEVTTVFIEHDMDVVERYADRVLVFSEGTILADGSPQEVFANADVKRHVLGEGY